MREIFNHLGYWTFSPNISKNQIEEIALQLQKDQKYKSLKICQVSNTSYSLFFELEVCGQNNRKVFNAHMRKIERFIVDRMGNELVDWSASNMYYLIQ